MSGHRGNDAVCVNHDRKKTLNKFGIARPRASLIESEDESNFDSEEQSVVSDHGRDQRYVEGDLFSEFRLSTPLIGNEVEDKYLMFKSYINTANEKSIIIN